MKLIEETEIYMLKIILEEFSQDLFSFGIFTAPVQDPSTPE
ncbi:11880_t:CDS:1, partial [Dentiscutata erythropus]